MNLERRPAWRVHPGAAGGGYAITLLKRLVLAGKLYRVGEVVVIAGRWELKVAANLIGSGVARPADQRTAVDAALLLEAQRVGPVTAVGSTGEQGAGPLDRKQWRGP